MIRRQIGSGFFRLNSCGPFTLWDAADGEYGDEEAAANDGEEAGFGVVMGHLFSDE